jgi:EAL domain-containing protein (putative c-di-GMP-specific phosphodiesterase class I)
MVAERIKVAISEALVGGGLDLVFQPICELEDFENAVFWEALVRFTHPTVGPIKPERIVKIARRLGLLDRLTQHVVDRAFETLTRVHEIAGPVRAGRGFSVNLEVEQLSAWSPLLETVLERARESGVAVMIEITERGLDDWTPSHTAVVHRLTQAGISVAIDDFGTGYAALGSLFRAPVDTIKIDRSMASSLDNARSRLLLRRIIETLHELGFLLVIEGEVAQADVHELRQLGVEFAQSHLVAEPMDAAAVFRWAERAREKGD